MWLFKNWWRTIAVVALILYAVLTPNPPEPDGLELFEGADKVVHACMMATLCAAVLYDRHRAGLRNGAAAVWTAALWVMAFGVLTELMQMALTDVRTGDAYDVLADWAGTAAVAAAAMLPPFRTPSGGQDTCR